MVFIVENLDIVEIWASLLNKIEGSVGKDVCEMWLKPMKPLSFEEGIFKIEMPNEVWLKTIKDRYEPHLLSCLKEIISTPFTIEYTLPAREDNNISDTYSFIEPDTDSSSPAAQSSFINRLNPHFLYDGFRRFISKTVRGTLNKALKSKIRI
jgi:chromosomal replication initiation ATPase DnaA